MRYFKKDKGKKSLKQTFEKPKSAPKSTNSVTDKIATETQADNSQNVQGKTEYIMDKGNNKKGWGVSDKIAFGALIFAGGALLFSYLTWKEAERSNNTISKQFEIENRPFIILSKVWVDTLRPDADLKAVCWIKNVGKTPALILNGAKTSINTYTSETPDNFDVRDSNVRRANIFLQTGDSIPFNFRGILPQKPQMYYQIMNSQLAALVYGEIPFKDIVSNKKYSYTFCIRILDHGRYAPTPLNNKFVEIKDSL